jgi:hypothetical protein
MGFSVQLAAQKSAASLAVAQLQVAPGELWRAPDASLRQRLLAKLHAPVTPAVGR